MVRLKVEVDKPTAPDIPFDGFTTASQNWSYLKFVYFLDRELFSWAPRTPALLSTTLRGLVRARRMSFAKKWSVLRAVVCGLWGGEGWRQAGRVQVWTCVRHSKSRDYRCLSHQTLATQLLQICWLFIPSFSFLNRRVKTPKEIFSNLYRVRHLRSSKFGIFHLLFLLPSLLVFHFYQRQNILTLALMENSVFYLSIYGLPLGMTLPPHCENKPSFPGNSQHEVCCLWFSQHYWI